MWPEIVGNQRYQPNSVIAWGTVGGNLHAFGPSSAFHSSSKRLTPAPTSCVTRRPSLLEQHTEEPVFLNRAPLAVGFFNLFVAFTPGIERGTRDAQGFTDGGDGRATIATGSFDDGYCILRWLQGFRRPVPRCAARSFEFLSAHCFRAYSASLARASGDSLPFVAKPRRV